jgi:cation transport regulator
MPYRHISHLPESVKDVLPKHAQEIYFKAFNNAHTEYWFKKTRRDPNESLESICHKVAWNAVKTKYKKTESGKWELKQKDNS